MLAPDERAALLARMRGLHERRIQELEAVVAADGFDDDFDRLTCDYALGLNRWAREWALAAEARLAATA